MTENHLRQNIQNTEIWSTIALDHIQDGVIVIDETRQIRYINAVAERLTGWTKATAQGRPLQDIFQIIDPKTGIPAKNPAILTLQVNHPVFPMRPNHLITQDGTAIPVTCRGQPIRDDQGYQFGAVLLFQVLSTVHQKENLLMKKTKKALQKSKQAVTQRERYLTSLVEIQQMLLAFDNKDDIWHKILKPLGKASEASRIYIFENHCNTQGNLIAYQRAIWQNQKLSPEIGVSVWQTVHYYKVLPRWLNILSKGEVVSGVISDFPGGEYEFLAAQGIMSILILPLMVNHQFFGFIGFDHCLEARPWDALEINLLWMAALAIARYNEHWQAASVLQQRNRELALFNHASQVFISTLDLDQVLNLVLEEVRHVLNVVACSIWLVDRESNEVICVQATGPKKDIVEGWRLGPGQGLVGRTIDQSESMIVPDVHLAPHHFKGVDRQTGLKIRSVLSIPLQVNQNIIGALQAVDEKPDRFHVESLGLLEPLATSMAIVIENARLYKQAHKDAETKAVLIQEINHRVKNNLSAIIGLLYSEKRHVRVEHQDIFQPILANIINRITGLATAHQLFSALGWSFLPLNVLATKIIHAVLQVLPPDKQVQVNVSTQSIQVTPKQASRLALMINELAMNTLKYALIDRQNASITVYLANQNDQIHFEFRDDGPGYPADVLERDIYNVGLYLVQKIVSRDLDGQLCLYNDHGAVTKVCFKSPMRLPE